MTEQTSSAAKAPENLYMQLNASELSAIIMKGSPNSNDRDAGFCSGSSEGGDDLSIDHSSRLDPSSPADASEDSSAEAKAMSLALIRNKRKSCEPSKVIYERDESTCPLKKRIRYTSSADSAVVALTPPAAHTPFSPPPPPPSAPLRATPTPTATPPVKFSPWDRLPHEFAPNPAQVFVRHPGVTTLHRMPPYVDDVQQEPLALVVRKKDASSPPPVKFSPWDRKPEDFMRNPAQVLVRHPGVTTLHRIPACVDVVQPEPLAFGVKKKAAPTTSTSTVSSTTTSTSTNSIMSTTTAPTTTTTTSTSGSSGIRVPSRPSSVIAASPPKSSTESDQTALQVPPLPRATSLSVPPTHDAADEQDTSLQNTSASSGSARPHQRNYKNMTRERRIEANARERTRVHTISAAYEKLRNAVPSYSNAQKLSKLSVLRVACSYILALSRMVGEDYSADQSAPSISSCFEAITATIQSEGKVRKKKDE